MKKKFPIVVLISGNGSNLQAIIDATQSGKLDASIALVVSNRADAYGLQRAAAAGIPTHVVRHKDYPSREAYDQALIECIAPCNPALIVLAGFMRILTPAFVQAFHERILNIHPSLLPLYPGLHTHQRAIEQRNQVHGCSIHLVTADLDDGPLLAQAQCPVLPSDTPETLAARVFKLEHALYPLVIQACAQGHLKWRDGTIWWNNQILSATGKQFTATDLGITLPNV